MTDAAWPAPSVGSEDDHFAVERALVHRARSDRAAFAQLYRMHVDAVYRFAYRRGGSREVAEEATATTFERALRSFDQFEWRDGGMRPWLFRIAGNEVTEIHRRRAQADGKRGQMAMHHLASHPAGEPEPGAEPAVDPEQFAAVRVAMERLPDRYREVISLRYLAGLTTDDAAAALGCSNRTLAVTLHRALGALKRELQRDTTKAVLR